MYCLIWVTLGIGDLHIMLLGICGFLTFGGGKLCFAFLVGINENIVKEYGILKTKDGLQWLCTLRIAPSC